ncbi:tetratricopeptide repeat protein [Candidatus Entotheonella palauensis]|uniref:tetratricopeptide repeat protein n=1 Tax=Candidatus Entotheonella palauensis TaxID=93172 RepID=UPI000B7E7715|nr:tetratricopeptide repeat protein [Candidatus Entotheonella palauensis]
MMRRRRVRGLIYGGVFIIGIACLFFAYHQHRYVHLIRSGNEAISEKRFDTQTYDQAGNYWLARRDILTTNQGMLAYTASNYTRAAEFFRQASQHAAQPEIEEQALYNLGRVFVELKDVERAAHFFKAALRINPNDHEAKFNLERLYHFVLVKKGRSGEASLEQAPGAGDNPNGNQGTDGQGRSKPKSDI